MDEDNDDLLVMMMTIWWWWWWWFGWTIPTHVLTPTGVDSARHVLVSWHQVDEQFRIDDDDDDKKEEEYDDG